MREKIKEMIVHYFREENFSRSHAIRLLSVLLESWATEKDYELKNLLLKQLVLRYAAAEKKLANLNRLKDKFLGIAAHDLRNPLVSIKGLSEILLDSEVGPLNDTQKELLTVICSTSNSMLSLVNDLLDLSVISSGRLELDLRADSLDAVVKERVYMNKIRAGKKQITIQEQYCVHPQLFFDRNRIAQVIDNLVDNAVKFSPPGSTVYVAMSHDDVAVKLSVRDEGPGVPEEDQIRIFGEFQKSSAQPTGDEKSTGLGLAIAKRIVDAHKGTLDVESEVGSGATFSLTLPLK